MPTDRIKLIVRFLLSITAGAFAFGCGDDDDNNSAGDTDTDSDTDADSDTDEDSDTDTETDTENNDDKYQWHAFYGSDRGDSVAIDGSGNVYTTGYARHSWNGPGNQNPLNLHAGGYCDVDGDMFEDACPDISIIKLGSNGAYQWHTFYGGNSEFDQGYSLRVDSSGNVYVTGEAESSWNGPSGQSPLNAYTGSKDVFVLKLDSSGEYQWHTFYGSEDLDSGYSSAIDGNGDIYVTGYSSASWNGSSDQSPLNAYSGQTDIFVLKMSSNGEYQWHTFFGKVYDSGSSIALDGNESIYVTGRSRASWNGPDGQAPLNPYAGNFDISALKLDSSGEYQWHIFFGNEDSDYGDCVAVDGDGNIYVTGYSNASWNGPGGQNPLNAYSGPYEIFVLKMSSKGEYQWHTFQGKEGGSSLAVDENNNIFVAGDASFSWNGPDGQPPLNPHSGGECSTDYYTFNCSDVFVLKLDAHGFYQWHSFYGGNEKDDRGNSLALDSIGNVFVTGNSGGSWNGSNDQSPLNAYSEFDDIFILKLTD